MGGTASADAPDDAVDRFAVLVSRLPIGVVVWDAADVTDARELRLLAANRAADEMLGFDVSGNVGRRLAEVFPRSAAHSDVDRALAVAGTDRADHMGEQPYVDEQVARRIFRRRAIGLPGHAVAFLMEDVTEERAQAARRRLLLQRLVDAGDRDRRTLAMALHDEPVQHLAAATMLVQSLRRRPDVPDLGDRLLEVERSLERITTSLRDAVFELAPAELEESGLVPALRRAADHLLTAQGVAVHLDVRCADELADAVQEAVHRIVVEAMTNVRKHAGAKSVEVRVLQLGDRVEVSVTDDGRGIGDGAGREPASFGLRMIRDRVEALGGRVRVAAVRGADGHPAGTVLRAAIPVDPPPDLAVVDLAEPLADEPPDVRDLRLERDTLLVSLVDADERRREAENRLRAALAFGRAASDVAARGGDVASAAAEVLSVGLGDGSAVLDRRGEQLRCVAAHHDDPAQRAWLRDELFADRDAPISYPGEVMRTGRSFLLNRGHTEWPLDLPVVPAPHPPHSALLVPLGPSDDVRGVVVVIRDVTPEPLSGADLELASALAEQLDALRRTLERRA